MLPLLLADSNLDNWVVLRIAFEELKVNLCTFPVLFDFLTALFDFVWCTVFHPQASRVALFAVRRALIVK
jgi:hypothetical protein